MLGASEVLNMKLFVSVLLLAAASAAFSQNKTPAPAPAQPAIQTSGWQVAVVDPGGQTAQPTFDALQSTRVPLAELMNRGVPTCYTMRSYRFSRPDPKSDATKLSGYSTCQAAATLQMRGIGRLGR